MRRNIISIVVIICFLFVIVRTDNHQDTTSPSETDEILIEGFNPDLQGNIETNDDLQAFVEKLRIPNENDAESVSDEEVVEINSDIEENAEINVIPLRLIEPKPLMD